MRQHPDGLAPDRPREVGPVAAILQDLFARRELGEILAVVADLEGDDEDARLLTSLTLPMVEPADEPGVMSGRLVRRIENMERFLRRIGKLDEFRRWVAGGDKVAEG